jgi:hypothetical protein
MLWEDTISVVIWGGFKYETAQGPLRDAADVQVC